MDMDIDMTWTCTWARHGRGPEVIDGQGSCSEGGSLNTGGKIGDKRTWKRSVLITD